MNSARESFQIGDYYSCLDHLQALQHSEGTPETYFTVKNNILACQTLILLSSGRSIANIEKQLEKLLENCLLTSRHTEISMKLQTTIFYNRCWLLLISSGGQEENIKRRLLFEQFFSFCAKVGRVTLLPENNLPYHKRLNFIIETKEAMISQKQQALGIFTELVVLIIIAMLPLSKDEQSLATIARFLTSYERSRHEILALTNAADLESSEEFNEDALKFNIHGPSTSLKHAAGLSFTLMALIQSTISIMQENYEPFKPHIFRCPRWDSFYFYLESLKLFNKGDDEAALGFALKAECSEMSNYLKQHQQLLLGQVYSNLNKRRKAIELFRCAQKLNRKSPITHYLVGREFGKLGLQESMLKCFQNLVKICRRQSKQPIPELPEVDHTIEFEFLRFIHDRQNITLSNALYMLAVAYGIHEMFEEASTTFEELMGLRLGDLINNSWKDGNGVWGIEMPHVVSIMHEAATMFLLTAQLHKAEVALCEAIRAYPAAAINMSSPTIEVHGTRDLDYIQNLLQDEYNLQMQLAHPQNKYYENYLSMFNEDIIGLLLLAEVQLIHESEDARATLNQALLLLSKYIAQTQRGTTEESKKHFRLVEALTAKTCFHLAKSLAKNRSFADVNKMYKRALSTNMGDKDILYNYACFLMDAKKIGDAEKLWNTFCDKEPQIAIEDIQSLALRHLLRSQVSLNQISDLLIKLGLRSK